MTDPVKCSTCGEDCRAQYVMCDQVEGAWCPKCFDATDCGKDKHGEGCPTLVFQDA